MNRIKHGGMIHMAELVAKRDKYVEFNLEERQKLFWFLLNFAKRAPIKIGTIILDKKYMNSTKQLRQSMMIKLNNFFSTNEKYLNLFSKVVVYYDNGQETMRKIIDKLIKNFKNVEHEVKFNKTKNRLFQVADMLTVIDKLEYKHNKKIAFTKAEKIFFSNAILDKIIKQLKNKRI